MLFYEASYDLRSKLYIYKGKHFYIERGLKAWI